MNMAAMAGEHNAPTTRKRRIEPWAVWPIAFFVILIAVHMVFIAKMTSADASSVEPNAYQRSAEYDDDLAALSHFKALGLTLTITQTDAQQVSCNLQLPDGVVMDGVVLEFYRPDSATLDQKVPWQQPGQPLSLALPRSGRWRVTLTGEVAGKAVRTSQQLML